MRSKSKLTLLLTLPLALAFAGACATTPSEPEELATEIVTALDRGERARADELFAATRRDPDTRELLYPKLYEQARGRYQAGDASGAVRLLDFLAKQYPGAVAVHQARVYSLFLERAGSDRPDPALVEETAAALAAWRASATSPPHWIDLVEAQVLIDRGDVPRAREAFERFVVGWNGRPEALAIYVEDVDRYLASH